MKKRSKKKFNKKNFIIGTASVVVLILLLSILITSSRENVVGEAFKTIKTSFRNSAITQAAKTAAALDSAPQVFNTKNYQSPVRAEPDDLLMIPGYGFKNGAVAVYMQATDNPASLSPPKTVPATNTAAEGQLKVVSNANLPDSITVLLPEIMKSRQPYVLWVKNPESSWSEPVLINDARPLWITPNRAYSTQQYASLPRELKVVGRNLESYIPRYGVHVKLVREGTFISAPTAYDLLAVNDGDPGTAIEHYVAKVKLPDYLLPGKYQALVSRDGTNWITVPQQFEVLSDPMARPSFSVNNYGCLPNDGLDDTGCIAAAINAAKNAGGGEVFFPAGKWELRDPTKSNDYHYSYYGLVVPPNVDLVGAGAKLTTITQTPDWKGQEMDNVLAAFTLMGNNTVRNLHLDSEGWNCKKGIDCQKYPYETGAYLTFFNLGKQPPEGELKQVENVRIHNCNFSRMYVGIETAGYPVRNLFIVNNVFQAYFSDLLFSTNPNIKDLRFNIEDSVIAHNIFYPGDFVKEDKTQGTIASQIGASERMDFSNNIADGYVNKGWRATYFFHMSNNHEMLLISQNKATCTGDKGGDGEAIVFDNSQNVMGFLEFQPVIAATSDTVSVSGNWLENTPGYYNEHWVFIADGKGIGQVRKIVSYTQGTPPAIKVSPAWDIIPDQTSKMVVFRNVWQSYVADNLIDTRNCLKTNYVNQSGMISWWGFATDSTIEGNRQYETDGILSLSNYQQHDGKGYFFLNYADEIRNNLIEGKYVYPGKLGGIQLWYAAGWVKGAEGGPADVSPVLNYNLAVSHNQIIKADTKQYQGAISLAPNWWAPKSTPYLVKNILIYKNNIKDSPTSGIYIHDKYAWNSVLYKNTFENIEPAKQIIDKGTNTVVAG